MCGNTFGTVFGHIPNLFTIPGDRYCDVLTVIDNVERVRSLRPEVLLTGHFDPIIGAETIDAELTRLLDAIADVHDQTVAGMNAGKDVRKLMAEITLPDHLEVGQGYGKVSLGRPLQAIHLAEIVTDVDPDHHDAWAVLRAAHESPLAGNVNFWETAWLTKQIERYRDGHGQLRFHRHRSVGHRSHQRHQPRRRRTVPRRGRRQQRRGKLPRRSRRIRPGWVRRLGGAQSDRALPPDGRAELVASEIGHLPAGRMGRINEIAPTIAFLCTAQSSYTSGAVFVADGASDCV